MPAEAQPLFPTVGHDSGGRQIGSQQFVIASYPQRRMCGLFERAMSKRFVSPESRQAFWIGFALSGWTYLGFSLVPSFEIARANQGG